MIIRRMTATFGRLENQSLELQPGLNIITAPNEAGKSTWAAFLRTMLYGIDTRDRDKKGYLADKNRYQPWSGAPMQGEMALFWRDREIVIRRRAKGAAPFARFEAVYAGTDEPVPGLTGENCGELLTGASREVYERSAFLGQGAGVVTAAPELERRIAALVTTGEEDVSWSEVQDRLRRWQRRRKHNKTGLIPQLEEELARVEHTKARLDATLAQRTQLRMQHVLLEDECKELEAERAAHRARAQYELDRRYTRALRERDAAQEALDALREESGTLPPRDALEYAQGELADLETLTSELEGAEQALHAARLALHTARTAGADPRFSGMTGGEALRKAQQDAAQVQDARRELKRLGQVKNAVLASLFSLGAVLACTAMFWIYLLIPAVVILCVGIPLSLRALRGKLDVQRACETEILRRYDAHDPDEFAPAAQEYDARQDEIAQHEAAVRRLEYTHADLLSRRETEVQTLVHFVCTFAPEVYNLTGCAAALSRALGREGEETLARQRLDSARELLDELAKQGAQAEGAELCPVVPERDADTVERQLAACTVRLDEAKHALARIQGEVDAQGDTAALDRLAARQEALEGELARRTTEYRALDAALEALHRANVHLQERFSPELNRRAGEYFARLTGGRYRAVALNRAFEAQATGADGVLPHTALALSQGTTDQLYLAVRLAVCDLCLSDGEAPPILLDDALAAFDAQRMEYAIELLAGLGAARQILLFTCHSREAAYLAGRTDAALLSL